MTRACLENQNAYANVMITSRDLGKLNSGERVTAYDLVSEAGFRATILSYGATLQSLTFPDGLDVVLGFDDLQGYLGEHPYFGCAVGRVANRISGARFDINGQRYELPKNENGNNLHSGPIGFDRVNWVGDIDGQTLILRHTSPDGHQGFPGELQTELRFTFEGSKLSLHIEAIVNKPCPVNISWHPYFNLTDGGATPCTDHQLQIHASFYTRTGAENLPTGDMTRAPCSLRYRYNDPRPITENDVLDQNFVVNSRYNREGNMVKMAKLSSNTTGHKVIICSTETCLQAYTGCHIPGIIGKSGTRYGPNHGIALEPQSYPDALNQDNFPDNVLQPGKIYSHEINYTFRPGEVQA